MGPELDALEAHLRRQPTDLAGWRVYADALTEHGAAALAAAILESADGRGRSLCVPAPEGIADVAWHMGLWRAARVEHVDGLRELVAHPAARMLERIVVTGKALDPDVLALAPPGVVRLEVEQPGRGDLPAASIGPLLSRLTELVWDGPLGGRVAGPLTRLRAHRLAEGAELELPDLVHLTLDQLAGGDLARLGRLAPMPALRTLRIASRAELRRNAVDALLRAPIARSLTRLVTPRVPTDAGQIEVVYAAESREDARAEADTGRTALIVAPAANARDDDGRSEFVRLAPPASPLEHASAFRDAVEAIGGVAATAYTEAWRAVPLGWGRTLAARMATVSGLPAQWLVLYPQGNADARGRLEEVEVSAAAWQVQPEGGVRRAAVSELADPWTTEVPDDWLSPGPTPPEEVEAMTRALVDEMVGEWLEVERVPALLPLERPDPWSPAAGARGPVPVQLGAAAVDPELGAYLVWRLRWVEVLIDAPAPDLSRWTDRLLRRHRLDRPPPGDHPFWDEWRDRTRPERAAAVSDRDRVGAHKLTAPGQWVLGEAEASLLVRALERPIDRHRPPPGVDLTPVLAALAAPGEITVTVA